MDRNFSVHSPPSLRFDAIQLHLQLLQLVKLLLEKFIFRLEMILTVQTWRVEQIALIFIAICLDTLVNAAWRHVDIEVHAFVARLGWQSTATVVRGLEAIPECQILVTKIVEARLQVADHTFMLFLAYLVCLQTKTKSFQLS